MKYKAFLAVLAIAALAVAGSAHAQTVPAVTVETEVTAAPVDPVIQMQNDLADLEAKENDPSIGAFAKFFIRLKIRELTNKLALAQAIQ